MTTEPFFLLIRESEHPNRRFRIPWQENGPDLFAHHLAINSSGLKTLDDDDQATIDTAQRRKGPAAAGMTVVYLSMSGIGDVLTPGKSVLFFFQFAGDDMAKSHYSFKKRKKEMARKLKQELKRQRKLEKSSETSETQIDESHEPEKNPPA